MENHHTGVPYITGPIQDTVSYYLPVEIVAQVFIHFVDSFQPFNSWLDGISRLRRRRVYAPPIILSAVCRNWRSIALITPELWTCPIVKIFDARSCHTAIEVLGLWLDRSRNLPLHISFLGNSDWHRGCYSNFETFFERAKTSSKRWETLRLDMNREAWRYFLKGFTCPPSLKRIQLITPEVEEAEWEVHDPANFVLPNSDGLEELRIQNLSLDEVDIAWENLIVFEADPWHLLNFEWLLGHAPRLKKCRIRDINGIGSGLPVHSHLEDLELQNSSSSDLESIIKWFTFPSLKRLVYNSGMKSSSLRLPHVNNAQMGHLQSFFVRSQCPLIELEIQVPFGTTADLVGILALLPSLERLTLHSCSFRCDNSAIWLSNESFEKHLKISILSRLLPQLKVFKILDARTFSWDALLPFLEPPHANVTSMRNTCIYIQFALYLPSQERSENYIDRDVVLRLKRRERKWKGAVSLDIKHRDSGEDWMQASLDYHEQTSSILE